MSKKIQRIIGAFLLVFLGAMLGNLTDAYWPSSVLGNTYRGYMKGWALTVHYFACLQRLPFSESMDAAWEERAYSSDFRPSRVPCEDMKRWASHHILPIGTGWKGPHDVSL